MLPNQIVEIGPLRVTQRPDRLMIAAMAMQGLLAYGSTVVDHIVERSFDIADALIKEEKTHGKD